jgi:hypothetical protein
VELKVLDIAANGLELLGSGRLHLRGEREHPPAQDADVAFRLRLKPIENEAVLTCWSTDLKPVTWPPMSAEFDGFSDDGFKVTASTRYAEVRGGVDWQGEIPKMCDLHCETVSIQPERYAPASDAANEIWTVPLLALDFQTDTYIEATHEAKSRLKRDSETDAPTYAGFSQLPGFSRVDWRGQTLYLDRRDVVSTPVGGIPITGSISFSAATGTPVEVVKEWAEVLYDLLAPKSGVQWKPNLFSNASSGTLCWRRGDKPLKSYAVPLQYPDADYRFITPYLEVVLGYYEALGTASDGQESAEQKALRALSRTLVAPLSPVESSIFATSTGFEILKTHFWGGKKAYGVSKGAASALRDHLRSFSANVRDEGMRSEYEDEVAAKSAGLLARPLRYVLDEMAQHYIGHPQSSEALRRLVPLRNGLVHGGVMPEGHDPRGTAIEARRVLWMCFTGLVGLENARRVVSKVDVPRVPPPGADKAPNA